MAMFHRPTLLCPWLAPVPRLYGACADKGARRAVKDGARRNRPMILLRSADVIIATVSQKAAQADLSVRYPGAFGETRFERA